MASVKLSNLKSIVSVQLKRHFSENLFSMLREKATAVKRLFESGLAGLAKRLLQIG
jgi:hypothetical protein